MNRETTTVTSETAARLHLAIHCMAQEAAFGVTIKFPPEVQHLADKTMGELTEDEARTLADAGIKARFEALGI
jgi:hypothetical protein